MTENAPKYIKMLKERVERLEAENAALRAKLNPPWLEKPDGEGLWWYEPGSGERRFLMKVKDFDGASAAAYYDHDRFRSIDWWASGRWSRAILPENQQ